MRASTQAQAEIEKSENKSRQANGPLLLIDLADAGQSRPWLRLGRSREEGRRDAHTQFGSDAVQTHRGLAINFHTAQTMTGKSWLRCVSVDFLTHVTWFMAWYIISWYLQARLDLSKISPVESATPPFAPA